VVEVECQGGWGGEGWQAPSNESGGSRMGSGCGGCLRLVSSRQRQWLWDEMGSWEHAVVYI
jgi:hypothetical protein